jgi:hypothetical protein
VQALKSRPVEADDRTVDVNHDNQHPTQDVKLPGPLGVESSTLQHTKRSETGDPELCRCGSCGSMLVQPTDWALIGRTHWRVTLRCPNCEWSGTGVFAQEAVDRFDRDLDRGMRKLQSTLTRVSRACMEAEIECFAKALETELIVPFDF